jgi:hypothetical protein
MEINVHNYKKVKNVAYRDRVRFLDDCIYTVQVDHLSICGGRNDYVFIEKLKLTDKYAFCSKAYEYYTTGGDWPCFRRQDYDAALRVIRAVFDALIEKGLIDKPKEKATIEESTSIKINVNTKFKPKIIL